MKSRFKWQSRVSNPCCSGTSFFQHTLHQFNRHSISVFSRPVAVAAVSLYGSSVVRLYYDPSTLYDSPRAYGLYAAMLRATSDIC